LDACMFRVLPVSDTTSASVVYFNVIPKVVIGNNKEIGQALT
jgi:hypothetical protein